jgi:hypothetical protein
LGEGLDTRGKIKNESQTNRFWLHNAANATGLMAMLFFTCI